MVITNELIVDNSKNSFVKLCGCGCGQPAPIAKYNCKRYGYTRGHSIRFIRGHATQAKPLIFKEPEKAEQILLGSLLGDGGVYNNKNTYYYKEGHSIKQKEYLLWKSRFLNLKVYTHRYKDKYVIAIYKTNICFKKYRKLFYPDGKKIVTREILDNLNPLGLAVWYLDDGNYLYDSSRIRLATLGFGLGGNKIIQKWFKERWNIDCKIYKEKNKINQLSYSLVFNRINSKSIIELINPYVIPSMGYKIGLDKEREKRIKECTSKRVKKYRERPEIKERRKKCSKEYYIKNIDKIKEHRRSPEFKEHHNKYMKVYRLKKLMENK